MSSENISIRARSIAIVGAGPSGVIAAKYLLAEKAFDRIVLFEQRDRPGGIWNATPNQRDEELFGIPQTDPHRGHQKPEWVSKPSTEKTSTESNESHKTTTTNGDSQVLTESAKKNDLGISAGIAAEHEPHTIIDASKTPSFLSPMYENLETNIPRDLMRFQDLDWPPDAPLFPKHETVLQYITTYSASVQDMVQYETKVLNIVPASPDPTGSWTVTTLNIRTKLETMETFDAVIVASGHFTVPYIPSIPHMKRWNERYPGRITHSKYYRRPHDFYRKKNVIVVGNSASGADISNQIAAYCAPPLLWAARTDSFAAGVTREKDKKRIERAPIVQFIPGTRGVAFDDGTQRIDVDAVVFATGYLYSMPFLSSLEPKVIGDGSHVEATFQHIFYHPRPTLAFLALNQRVIPFPVAEAQAAVVARVFAGRLELPGKNVMARWERDLAATEKPKNFHLLPFPHDGVYINEMAEWVSSAIPKEGLENDGMGKSPPIWGNWEFWCRENFPAIRKAFVKKGWDRREIRSIKEVGFDYEEFVKKRKEEEDVDTEVTRKQMLEAVAKDRESQFSERII